MKKEFNLVGPFDEENPFIKDRITNSSADPILEHLDADEKNTAVLNIHSTGGSANILSYLKGKLRPHKSRIEAKIIGVAASAGAALPISVANKISINKGARIMVHLPHIDVQGNSEDLESKINLLKIIDEEITEDLSVRSKLSKDEAKEMLRKETWLDADEALNKGIVDEIITPPSAEFVEKLVLQYFPKISEENKDLKNKVKKEEKISDMNEDNKTPKTPEVETKALNPVLDVGEQRLVDLNAGLESRNAMLSNENQELRAENAKLKVRFEEELNIRSVNGGIARGAFPRSKAEEYLTYARAGGEMARKHIDNMPSMYHFNRTLMGFNEEIEDVNPEITKTLRASNPEISESEIVKENKRISEVYAQLGGSK